ncbi:hypothetical protein HUT06_33750 [Actinomadura sp. NAK00032]|uniref:hypothetical protein n=1 Tax=Actinomadura sp. NAK00032 TaxID=2742128 RepID=UPI0015909B43|nr:hypothetical protein [Actinomadura sp. NAK00032]QKW38365.1 hypothetical protein HUT06_33750 [Actinomadura sp. NAK00032]
MVTRNRKARNRARRRRRLALLLERPPTIVKVICAIPAFAFALETGVAGFALVNNGEGTIASGTGIVRTCTRDPATGWLMYQCGLEDPRGAAAPVDSTVSRAGELKTLTRPHGTIAFEIRKTTGSKSGQASVTVERGTPRYSVLVQMLVFPVGIAAFFVVFVPLLRLVRLAARAARPRPHAPPEP